MTNQELFEQLIAHLRTFLKSGENLKTVTMEDSAFVTFGYVPYNQETLHDSFPLVLIYFISKTRNDNGYMLGFNLHHIVNREVRKMIIDFIRSLNDLSYTSIFDGLKALQYDNPREFTIIMRNLKASLKRYEFSNIMTKVKTLNRVELDKYLKIWSKPDFVDVMEFNKYDGVPLSKYLVQEFKKG